MTNNPEQSQANVERDFPALALHPVTSDEKRLRKNVSLSCAVGKSLPARPSECFYNAFRVVTELSEFNSATYVEGVAVDVSGSSIGDHGWVVNNDEIIDPTLPDRDLLYFPVLRVEGSKALQQSLRDTPRSDHHLPLFWRLRDGGIRLPSIQMAWDELWAYSNGVLEEARQREAQQQGDDSP